MNEVSDSDEANTSGREVIPTSKGLSRVIPMSEVESDAHPNRSGRLTKTMVASWDVFLIDDSVYERR